MREVTLSTFQLAVVSIERTYVPHCFRNYLYLVTLLYIVQLTTIFTYTNIQTCNWYKTIIKASSYSCDVLYTHTIKGIVAAILEYENSLVSGCTICACAAIDPVYYHLDHSAVGPPCAIIKC